MSRIKAMLKKYIKLVKGIVVGIIVGLILFISACAATIYFDGINVGYDHTTSGLTSDNVQDVLDELYNGIRTATFNLNGASGSTPESITIRKGCPMPMPILVPKRDGFEFQGWYDNTDYTQGTQYYTASGASARNYDRYTDVTLYAGWKPGVVLFKYTGHIQTYTAPIAGTYLLEVWGAQGGASTTNGSTKDIGGKGGYSQGTVSLTSGQTIYIVVGGKGGTGKTSGCAAGGYNGGGTGTNDGGGCGSASDDEGSGGGGGATHIAKVTGTLSSLSSNTSNVYLVAGGGGGASFTYAGGVGGGTNGGYNSSTSSKYPTQTTGYQFGQGQNGSGAADSDGVAGGGGGWYGGYANNVSAKSAGTGGSGYIGGVSSGIIKDGSKSFLNPSGGNETGHAGNGYARITYMD